jgi:hypothetical protein
VSTALSPKPTTMSVPTDRPAFPHAAPERDSLPRVDSFVATRRVDHLLEFGRLLVRLAETAIEEEGNSGQFLPGAFQGTRIPLQLKEIGLMLTAYRALDGLPPQTVVRLVEAPSLSRQQISSAILIALDEINAAIEAEAPGCVSASAA